MQLGFTSLDVYSSAGPKSGQGNWYGRSPCDRMRGAVQTGRSERVATFRRTSRLTGRRHVFLPHPAVAWTSICPRVPTPRYRCLGPLPEAMHIGTPDLRFCDTSAHLIKAAHLPVTDRRCALHGPRCQRPREASPATVPPSHWWVQDMRIGTSEPNAHNGSVP